MSEENMRNKDLCRAVRHEISVGFEIDYDERYIFAPI
jgi:hypothetical protein